MKIKVNILGSDETPLWDNYVMGHPDATLYHLSGWRNVIKNTYGHNSYYLIAKNEHTFEDRETQSVNNNPEDVLKTDIVGVLPLIHLKHFLFGNNLVSIPFFDLGGVLANNEDIGKILLFEALNIADNLNVNNIELRHLEQLPWLNSHWIQKLCGSSKYEKSKWIQNNRSHKVRMVLDLPESSDALLLSFKAKLRSQIKRPIKEGLYAKSGSLELLDDFYNVFSINMRDLGSPVHSRKLIENVLIEFPGQAKIFIIYKDHIPIACSLIIGFRDMLENPWASTIRIYSSMSPNMLLYWKMLEHGCDNGFKKFDFGRSTPLEGTYKFKEQWGATPHQLNWQHLTFGNDSLENDFSEKKKYLKAINYWQRIPVFMTKILGPHIRKYISL